MLNDGSGTEVAFFVPLNEFDEVGWLKMGERRFRPNFRGAPMVEGEASGGESSSGLGDTSMRSYWHVSPLAKV